MTRAALRRRLDPRDERGFTLIEMLVAMLAGGIVASATLAIVIVSVHLTSNYNDRVDANQQGRMAIEQITQALNSSCVSAATAPVLAAGEQQRRLALQLAQRRGRVNPNKVDDLARAGSCW